MSHDDLIPHLDAMLALCQETNDVVEASLRYAAEANPEFLELYLRVTKRLLINAPERLQ